MPPAIAPCAPPAIVPHPEYLEKPVPKPRTPTPGHRERPVPKPRVAKALTWSDLRDMKVVSLKRLAKNPVLKSYSKLRKD